MSADASTAAEVCLWTWDNYQECHTTECGQAFCYEDCGPELPATCRYCQWCGRRVAVLRFTSYPPEEAE